MVEDILHSASHWIPVLVSWLPVADNLGRHDMNQYHDAWSLLAIYLS